MILVGGDSINMALLWSFSCSEPIPLETAKHRASALHSSRGAPFAHFMLALSISAWENRDIQPGNVYEDDEGHPWTEARIQPA